jgi:hypothetical protein
VIVVAVRWYLRYGLSYRDVEELLAERGIQVDHVTVYRWVQRFTPLLADAARCTQCNSAVAGLVPNEGVDAPPAADPCPAPGRGESVRHGMHLGGAHVSSGNHASILHSSSGGGHRVCRRPRSLWMTARLRNRHGVDQLPSGSHGVASNEHPAGQRGQNSRILINVRTDQ